MMDWLLASVDPGRPHAVGWAVSWHARTMVLAWGVIAPLAIIAARFLKILPWQDWPRELDNPTWWRFHWMGQSLATFLTLVGLGLVWGAARGGSLHGMMGYGVIALALFQIALGLARGSKGGPTAPARDGTLRGHHYDLTPWRRTFEMVHKSLGYITLALAIATVLVGLWHSNGPRWMWLVLGLWWTGLLLAFVILQKRGWAADTYQAIWGPDPEHPGNRIPSQGGGMRRRQKEKDGDVRRT